MNPDVSDPAGEHFDCSDRERAAFEAGIKLGTLYHQFVGVPVSKGNIEGLEKCMEQTLLIQPFTKVVKVRIDDMALSHKEGVYDYSNLSGEMLELDLIVEYGKARAICKLEMKDAIDYPLMSLRIEEE